MLIFTFLAFSASLYCQCCWEWCICIHRTVICQHRPTCFCSLMLTVKRHKTPFKQNAISRIALNNAKTLGARSGQRSQMLPWDMLHVQWEHQRTLTQAHTQFPLRLVVGWLLSHYATEASTARTYKYTKKSKAWTCTLELLSPPSTNACTVHNTRHNMCNTSLRSRLQVSKQTSLAGQRNYLNFDPLQIIVEQRSVKYK